MERETTVEEMGKPNRRRVQEAERLRPVVHGALPYLGHRAKPKAERRRLALLVRGARKP
jgi:hypothetical protein